MSQAPPVRRPVNLGLNDGTYCSPKVIERLRAYDSTTSLRNYPTPDNDALREAIARECGCAPENIYLAAGSGPILKQAIPLLIEQGIRRSPLRVLKHLLRQPAYPIITPSLTYFKVPLKAEAKGLPVRYIPLRAEQGFTLSTEDIAGALGEGDGLLYLANPNNPTGTVLMTRAQAEALIPAHPGTTFWIDEAYIQYVPPEAHGPLVDLVTKHPNVVCSRTFSFAHGLAALKVGYLIAPAELVAKLEADVTNYRIPALCEDLAVAAMADPDHMPFIRARTAEALAFFKQRFAAHPKVRVYDSHANFVLCELTDGADAKALCARVLERGFKLKTFTPVGGQRFENLFRITYGTPEENAALMDVFDALLG